MSYDNPTFYCPLDDGPDFEGEGGTNCGGEDFGSRLRLDLHYAQAHLHMAGPVFLALAAAAHRPSSPAAYAEAMAAGRLFVGSTDPDFHGAPPAPGSNGGWGLLGLAAGVGQGLPDAVYVIWSQGTPIAWRLSPTYKSEWVFPRGDYYVYDRVTSRHQNKIGQAFEVLGAAREAS